MVVSILYSIISSNLTAIGGMLFAIAVVYHAETKYILEPVRSHIASAPEERITIRGPYAVNIKFYLLDKLKRNNGN